MLWAFAPLVICPLCDVDAFPYGAVHRPAFFPTAWQGTTFSYRPRVLDLFVRSEVPRQVGQVRPEAYLYSVRMDGGRSAVVLMYGQPVWWGRSVWVGVGGHTGAGERAWVVGGTFPGGEVVGGGWNLATGYDTLVYRWVWGRWGWEGGEVIAGWEPGGGWVEGRWKGVRLRGWRRGWLEGAVRFGGMWMGAGRGPSGRVVPWVEARAPWGDLEIRGVPSDTDGVFLRGRLRGYGGEVEGFSWMPREGHDVWGGAVQIQADGRWLWLTGRGVWVSPPGNDVYPLQVVGVVGVRGVYREVHEIRLGGGGVWMDGSANRPPRGGVVGIGEYRLGEVFWIHTWGGWMLRVGWDRRGVPDLPWFLQMELGAWIAD